VTLPKAFFQVTLVAGSVRHDRTPFRANTNRHNGPRFLYNRWPVAQNQEMRAFLAVSKQGFGAEAIAEF
jgi:hypothetical protein